MFRVVLQENRLVLKGLIASLLHLEHQNIKNIVIIQSLHNYDAKIHLKLLRNGIFAF